MQTEKINGINYSIECIEKKEFSDDSSFEAELFPQDYPKKWEKYNKIAEEEAKKEAEAKAKNEKRKTKALWYGVRAPPMYDTDKCLESGGFDLKFYKEIQKFLKSDSIEQAVYNFEWKYDAEGNRYGIHSHMLLFGDFHKIKFHIKRQKKKMFNLNPKQLQDIKDNEIVGDKLGYMNGDIFCENDHDKIEEKKCDKKMREVMGWENFETKKCDFCEIWNQFVKNGTDSDN